MAYFQRADGFQHLGAVASLGFFFKYPMQEMQSSLSEKERLALRPDLLMNGN